MDYLSFLLSLMNAGLKDRPYIVFNSDESVLINHRSSPRSHEHVQPHQLQACEVCSAHQSSCCKGDGEIGNQSKHCKDEKQKEKVDLIMGNYWKARHAGTHEVYAKYMKKILELSSPIYDYILS